jgi:Pirin
MRRRLSSTGTPSENGGSPRRRRDRIDTDVTADDGFTGAGVPPLLLDDVGDGAAVRTLGADRHQTRIGWLHGRHSLDTGVDLLGTDTHHGVLVVSNHDTIAPRSGFETHPHRNMEIVTWVLNGSLVHQDSEGHLGVIYPNLAQRMTAGTGIRHSEKNDRSAVNPVV